jgi:hypothetical protein
MQTALAMSTQQKQAFVERVSKNCEFAKIDVKRNDAHQLKVSGPLFRGVDVFSTGM